MAKQLGVLQYSGKLGQTVGNRKARGQRSATVRVRAAEVANPRTNLQILRRMRMLPASLFYSKLQEILNHSFQGVQYGSPSQAFFMQQALKNEEFPYITKGSAVAAPGKYLISKGSLNNIYSWLDATGLQLDAASGVSYSNLTEALIHNNPWLRAGDQLTFVAVLVANSEESDELIYDVRRYVLNSNVNAPWPDWLKHDRNESDTYVDYRSIYEDPVIYATAVIVSRPRISASGKVTWLRSTTYLDVQPTYWAALTSSAAFDAAVESYQNADVNATSDYYLNQGGGAETGGDSSLPQEVTITVVASGHGTVTGGGTYRRGQSVTLSFHPEEGYICDALLENGEVLYQVNGSNGFFFTASRDMNLTARFVQDVPTPDEP